MPSILSRILVELVSKISKNNEVHYSKHNSGHVIILLSTFGKRYNGTPNVDIFGA